jgi:hypothetical protein
VEVGDGVKQGDQVIVNPPVSLNRGQQSTRSRRARRSKNLDSAVTASRHPRPSPIEVGNEQQHRAALSRKDEA